MYCIRSLPVSLLVAINSNNDSYDDERKTNDEEPGKRREPAPSPDYERGVAPVESSNMAGFHAVCATVDTGDHGILGKALEDVCLLTRIKSN